MHCLLITEIPNENKSAEGKAIIDLVMCFTQISWRVVPHSMQPSYVSKAAIKPGAAAEVGEIEKDEKHDRVVTQAGGHFYQLIVKTLGHWSLSSLETLKTIASKASSMNSIPFSQTYSNLMEQLSVRLWQYNA